MDTEQSALPRVGAGAVLYAKDMGRLAAFYSAIAGFAEIRRDDDFVVLHGGGIELVVVAIPERIASGIDIASPPRRREGTPIKLFFVVPDLAKARRTVAELGGEFESRGREWQFRHWRVCDGCDPEGNLFQLREFH
jgi:predicted enzyme related to lactoylglutathione lyase